MTARLASKGRVWHTLAVRRRRRHEPSASWARLPVLDDAPTSITADSREPGRLSLCWASSFVVSSLLLAPLGCSSDDSDAGRAIATSVPNDGRTRVPTDVYLPLPDDIEIVDVVERPLTELDQRLMRTTLLVRIPDDENPLSRVQQLAGRARNEGYAVTVARSGKYPALEGRGPHGVARFGSLPLYLEDELRQALDATTLERFRTAAAEGDLFRFLVVELDPPSG